MSGTLKGSSSTASTPVTIHTVCQGPLSLQPTRLTLPLLVSGLWLQQCHNDGLLDSPKLPQCHGVWLHSRECDHCHRHAASAAGLYPVACAAWSALRHPRVLASRAFCGCTGECAASAQQERRVAYTRYISSRTVPSLVSVMRLALRRACWHIKPSSCHCC